MRVLFVKLTSMGDLIHALPALTDALRAIPQLSVDWVVDKNFSEVATWHPAVNNIIPTAHRRWRKNIWQSIKSGEIKEFIKTLRKEKYDLIIDGQASIKSIAAVLLAKKALRCGLDKNSSREWIAHLAYQKKYAVDRNMHAVKRLRLLFSQVLNYPYVDDQPDYGLKNYTFPALKFELTKPYLVFVHNASWQSKLWPEDYWRQLIKLAAADRFRVVIPWGNQAEKERALRLSADHANAEVLPFSMLSEHASILKGSHGAICSDTGLAHLAAALDVPALTLYGSTSTKLIGTLGLHQEHLVSSFSCITCYKRECDFENRLHPEPLCQLAMKPEVVWERFKAIQKSSAGDT